MSKKNKHAIISTITLLTLAGTICAGGRTDNCKIANQQVTVDRYPLHIARIMELKLARAIKNQNLTLVQRLLKAGANAAGYNDQFTPLIQVALMKECPIATTAFPETLPANPEIVRLLVTYGANPSETNMCNQSAIDIAKEIGDPALMAALQ